MGEFSVNTGRMKSIADLLEQQANDLENAGESIDSIKNNLRIESSARGQIMSALRTTTNNVKEESQAAARVGRALREIAATYRSAENTILGAGLSDNGAYTGGGGKGSGSGAFDGSQNGNNRDSAKYSGDPVNLNTGNFILDNHDMEIPGFQAFVLGRFYNSMGTFSGMLGNDWNTGFEMKLVTSAERYLHGADICVVLEDGREEYFALINGKKYVSLSGTTAELIKEEDGYGYRTLGGNYYRFDGKGRYRRFEDLHHVGFNLIYHNDILERVEKDSGEYFEFSYENGFLSTVKDHTGRTCRYVFENDRLCQAVLPDGSSYQYFYNTYGKICRVVNPRMVGAVETEYDEQFRVVYQRFADGTTNTFEYQDEMQAVVMFERNGSRSVHYHNEKYQNVRNVYPDGEERFEYNERGQKTSITDKLGNVTYVQYDDKGNVACILYPDKTKIAATYNQQNRLLTLSVNGRNKVRNQYNTMGDLICTEDGIGRKTSYVYDERGRMIEACMPDGTKSSAEYDKRGNLCMVKNTNGAVVGFAYDALNQMVQHTNALGQKQGFAYDVMGRIISETRADGMSKYYQYDEWGNIVSVRDFDGSVTEGTYNANNKLESLTDAAGRKTYFEYDAMWNVTKAVMPNGAVIQYLYDANNHLELVRDAEGNETHYTYDAVGNRLSQTNAEGAVTSYVWDFNGRCEKVIAADGSVTEYKYDEDDQVIYVKDAEGVELFRHFDEAGQLISEEDSLGRMREYAYSEAGDLIAVIDEHGRKTAYTYETGLHKVREIVYPNGTKQSYTYDLNGNIRTYTDIYGKALHYEYDNLDRLTAMRTDQGTVMEYTYDLLNRVTAEKDFDGNVTEYEYSVTGQLLKIKDALGTVTQYTYDPMDELVEVCKNAADVKEQIHLRYERNLMGHVTKVTDALGMCETYQYNGLGKIAEKTDRGNFSTKYAYNVVGLLQRVIWADGKTAEYEYSPLRRLNKITDWTGVTQVDYDGQGKPLQIIYPDSRKLTMEYDAVGNRTQVCYPDGKEVSYEYDSLSRLEKVIQDDTVVTYTYDPMGNVASRSFSNGTDIRYQYDEHGMLSGMTHTDSLGIVDDWTYGYDAAGRRTRHGLYRRDHTQDNGNYEYTYDVAGRLQKVMKDDCMIREYSYDWAGNRSSMTELNVQSGSYERTDYEYDLRGSLLKLSGASAVEAFKYDQRGNLTELVRNGQTQKKYSYDALNRLSMTQNARGEQAIYHYNGLGYRVGMQVTGNGREKAVSYVLDYSRIYDNLLEKKENDQTETYIWGNGLEGFAAGTGSSGWYITDSLGSVLRKMDRNDTLYVENYDEFGRSMLTGTNEADTFGYNGFQFDSIAGTYFAQARQYRSYTGTFDAMDRFGGDITMPSTLHPYSYCVHDPFNHTDKSAYWFGIDDAIAAGLGAVGGLAGQLVEDVIDGVTTGEFDFSWQEYVGSAVGGAAGGVTTLYAGPIAGGAVAGGLDTLTSEGLKKVTEPNYEKSWGDIAWDTVKDTGLGAIGGAISQIGGKITQKIAGSGPVKNIVSKMKNGGKILNKIAENIDDIARGKSDKIWGQMSKYLKNQHDWIAKSPALKKKLFSVLLGNLPIYFAQEVWGSTWDSVKKKGKEGIWKWIRDLFGWDDFEAECAAAA